MIPSTIFQKNVVFLARTKLSSPVTFHQCILVGMGKSAERISWNVCQLGLQAGGKIRG